MGKRIPVVETYLLHRYLVMARTSGQKKAFRHLFMAVLCFGVCRHQQQQQRKESKFSVALKCKGRHGVGGCMVRASTDVPKLHSGEAIYIQGVNV